MDKIIVKEMTKDEIIKEMQQYHIECRNTPKVPVDEFIENHNYTDYCEAIIHTNGLIEYARPSHVYALIRVTNRSEEDIYEEMPVWESPIHWLVKYTGCISIWSDFCILPDSCTNEQIVALGKLIASGLTKKKWR